MATQAEKDKTRQQIAECGLCDDDGWRWDHGGRDGDTPAKCRHGTLEPAWRPVKDHQGAR